MELETSTKPETVFKSLRDGLAQYWPANRPGFTGPAPHSWSHLDVIARCSATVTVEQWASSRAAEAMWRLARSIAEDAAYNRAVEPGSGVGNVFFKAAYHGSLGRAVPTASQEEIERLRRLIAERELECNGLEKQIETLKAGNQSLKTGNDAHRANNQTLRADLKRADNSVSEQRRRIADLERDVTTTSAHAHASDQALEPGTPEPLVSVAESAAKAHATRLEKRNADLVQNLKTERATLGLRNLALQNSAKEATGLRGEVRAAQKELQDLRPLTAQVAQLQRAIGVANTARVDAMARMREAEGAATRLSDASSQLANRDATISSLHSQLADLQRQLASVKSVPPDWAYPQPRPQAAQALHRRLSLRPLAASLRGTVTATGHRERPDSLVARLVFDVYWLAVPDIATLRQALATTLDIERRIASHEPTHRWQVVRVGSLATSTAIRLSLDIDLTIKTGYEQPADDRDLRTLETLLAPIWVKSEIVGKVSTLRTRNFPVDITVNSSQSILGMAALRSMLAQTEPDGRVLVRLVKCLLAQSDIPLSLATSRRTYYNRANDTYRGGLSSHAAACMVVYSLMRSGHDDEAGARLRQNAWQRRTHLLLAFFDFFGSAERATETMAFARHQDGRWQTAVSGVRRADAKVPLWLARPEDSNVNVLAGCFNAPAICRLFRAAAKALRDAESSTSVTAAELEQAVFQQRLPPL